VAETLGGPSALALRATIYQASFHKNDFLIRGIRGELNRLGGSTSARRDEPRRHDHQQSIITLHARGWSARRIARELGMHREAVDRELKVSKPAKVTIGSEERSRSHCEEWRTMIAESLQASLSARRIFQDLQTEKSYAGGYESVKRFVRALPSEPDGVRLAIFDPIETFDDLARRHRSLG